jgi:hypothetical protein
MCQQHWLCNGDTVCLLAVYCWKNLCSISCCSYFQQAIADKLTVPLMCMVS